MTPEEQKDYDDNLKKRVLVLKKMFDEGKIKIVEDSNILKSLESARFDSDGNPDLSTIDATVRSIALAAEYFYEREEAKKTISSIEIQSQYFIYSPYGNPFFNEFWRRTFAGKRSQLFKKIGFSRGAD